MVLATRCPHCQTAFRVQEAQLARSRGLVRCGNCHETFDALQNLLDTGAPVATAEPRSDRAQPQPPHREPAPVPEAPDAGAFREPMFAAPSAPETAPRPSPRRPGGVEHAPAAHEEPTLAAEPAPATLTRPDPEPRFRQHPPQPEGLPSEEQPSVPPVTGQATFDPPPAAPADDGVHFAVTRERRTKAPGHPLWRAVGVVITLVLLVLLAAQLAWWQRESVMVYWPESQSIFASVCQRLGCQLSVPRDIDGLQVEASDLRQVDGPHRLELRVPLRNRFRVPLAYPAMELTLYDAKNEVAIRRVLWPQDYVPPGTVIARGLPPHTTQTMIVRLDSGNAVATNFRVQIFYP